MNGLMTASKRILVLGAGSGWHADQISAGARLHGMEVSHASYESLRSSVALGAGSADGLANGHASDLAISATVSTSEAGDLASFDAVLLRTMPAGSLEQITFRLAILHAHYRSGGLVVNSPRGLEIAIDKFAALSEVARLGFSVPETVVVQNRDDAMAAFDRLGSDCVVKPIFGGEGRGVMRLRDRQLAWVTFSTLCQLGAVSYVQRFIPPGGRDTRLLVVGDDVFAIRRTCHSEFRTNALAGAESKRIDPTAKQRALALAVTRQLNLDFAAVDLIDNDAVSADAYCVLEVNGIPGWKSAQAVLEVNIGERLAAHLRRRIDEHQNTQSVDSDTRIPAALAGCEAVQRAAPTPQTLTHSAEDSR